MVSKPRDAMSVHTMYAAFPERNASSRSSRSCFHGIYLQKRRVDGLRYRSNPCTVC